MSRPPRFARFPPPPPSDPGDLERRIGRHIGRVVSILPPPSAEMIRDWCLDRAWEIRGWPERWRQRERLSDQALARIVWGSLALGLIGFWGAVIWLVI